jgi:antibiotic biosynthesis monooxygenase (ABM) superfamily enzyme
MTSVSEHRPTSQPVGVPPPTKHQLALMIWLSVFPTLLLVNVALGDWLRSQPTILRTLLLTTIAVPIVIYGLMPQLHRVRARLLLRKFRAV